MGKLVVLGQNWLYSEKVVVIGQNCCNPENGCIRAKVVVFGKVVVFRQRCLYLDKNGYISGKSGCIRAKVVVFLAKWLYSVKAVVLGKVAIFGQNWLNSGKSGCIRDKVLVFEQSGSIRQK